MAAVVALSATASGQTDGEAAPIYGIKLPAAYREWTLISVAHAGGPVKDMRAKLGNDVAIKAYREANLSRWHDHCPAGVEPGAVCGKQQSPSRYSRARIESGSGSATLAESFIAGAPTNLQFMVKDSKKYASTVNLVGTEKTAGEAVHKTCFPCHEPANDRDFVYTRYAP